MVYRCRAGFLYTLWTTNWEMNDSETWWNDKIVPRRRVRNHRLATPVRVMTKALHLNAFVAELSSIQLWLVSRWSAGSPIPLYLVSGSLSWSSITAICMSFVKGDSVSFKTLVTTLLGTSQHLSSFICRQSSSIWWLTGFGWTPSHTSPCSWFSSQRKRQSLSLSLRSRLCNWLFKWSRTSYWFRISWWEGHLELATTSRGAMLLALRPLTLGPRLS